MNNYEVGNDFEQVPSEEEIQNLSELSAQRYGSRLRNFFKRKEAAPIEGMRATLDMTEGDVSAAEDKEALKEKRREKLVAALKKKVALALVIIGLGGGPKEAKTEGGQVTDEDLRTGPDVKVEQRMEVEDDDEDISIEDLLEEGYQAPELERQEVNGAEFITDGTKEIEGLGEVRTFKYVGGHVKENNRFYMDGKRQPYAYGGSFEGETPVERFEEWEMSLAMEPKALAAAVDQFNLEEELGIEEFQSLEDADKWANMVAELPADEYDQTVNSTIARVLNKIHGVETSRDCKLARDMRDTTESPTESEGEDDVETYGQLRGNKSALQLTFVGEGGENVCSDPEAFEHIIESLSPAEQKEARRVGNKAWLNIGEYGEKKNGGLAGNWEFKEGKRETTTPEPSDEPTPVITEKPTPTPTAEVTPTPTPTAEVTPTPTPSEKPTPTPTEKPTPTPTAEITPTPTPEVTPTPTPKPTPEVTPTPTPEVTPTPTPTPTPKPTPEVTPTPTPTATKNPEAEQEHAQSPEDAGTVTQTQDVTEQEPITQEPTRAEAPHAEQSQPPAGSEFTAEELAQMQADLGGQ